MKLSEIKFPENDQELEQLNLLAAQTIEEGIEAVQILRHNLSDEDIKELANKISKLNKRHLHIVEMIEVYEKVQSFRAKARH